MIITLNDETLNISDVAQIVLPAENVVPKAYNEVVIDAIDNPIDCLPLKDINLENKSICIIVDDWGRPTPAGEFLPDVLSRLNSAGAKDKDITIVTASGMHEPMEAADLLLKVGEEAFKRVRCVSHDAGNNEMLEYVGISDMGSPVWVNKYVAKADFKIALGRIHPHCCYGYEGGYKMIVPGVASFETIIRDHSLNFSKYSNYGEILNNPSRREAEAIGKMVGIDFLVNFVMNFRQEPVVAYGGTPDAVFNKGVDFGERHVWCNKTVDKSDIVIISSNEDGNTSLSNNPIYYIGLAQIICKPDAIIIAKMNYVNKKKEFVNGEALEDMSLPELLRLHEKRNWSFSSRKVQHTIKSIRGEYFYRRAFELRSQRLFLVTDKYSENQLQKWNASRYETLQNAYDTAVRDIKNPKITVIPEAHQTLPLINYSI